MYIVKLAPGLKIPITKTKKLSEPKRVLRVNNQCIILPQQYIIYFCFPENDNLVRILHFDKLFPLLFLSIQAVSLSQ